MLFLIEYDRPTGRLVSFRTFDDQALRAAQDARLELELCLFRQGIQREVVLLEAQDEAALHRTHRRYFASLAELLADPLPPPAR